MASGGFHRHRVARPRATPQLPSVCPLPPTAKAQHWQPSIRPPKPAETPSPCSTTGAASALHMRAQAVATSSSEQGPMEGRGAAARRSHNAIGGGVDSLQHLPPAPRRRPPSAAGRADGPRRPTAVTVAPRWQPNPLPSRRRRFRCPTISSTQAQAPPMAPGPAGGADSRRSRAATDHGAGPHHCLTPRPTNTPVGCGPLR